MLLTSDRHKQADLALWKELEEADRINAGRLLRSGKVERSIKTIRAFAAAGPCYAAVSWGKDSVVLAHLARTADPTISLANVAQHGLGYDFGVPAVRDEFLLRFPGPYHEESVPLTAIPDTGKHSPALDIGIARLAKRYGTSRYLGGIRADESGVRKIGLKTRGLTTLHSCQPIGWWTADDVFAYLSHYDLPIHPAYAMLGGGRWGRRQIRVSTIGGPKGTQFGRRDWELEYYGDVLRRIDAAKL